MEALPPAAPVSLTWGRAAGAESCIDVASLGGRVEATLGRRVTAGTGSGKGVADAARAGDDAIAVAGHVAPGPAGRGWLAVVEVARTAAPALRREVSLDAVDCRQLDEALVLVVALMVDAAMPSVPALTLAPAPSPLVVTVGPDVAFALGMLPGLAIGFGLAGSVAAPGFWPVAVWAHGWPDLTSSTAGPGGSFGAWTAGAGLCPRLLGRELALVGCVGASAGAIDSMGMGLGVSLHHVRPYVDVGFRLGLRVPVTSQLFVRAELGVGVPLARDEYVFTAGDGSARAFFRTAAFVPVARLGFEVQAP